MWRTEQKRKEEKSKEKGIKKCRWRECQHWCRFECWVQGLSVGRTAKSIGCVFEALDSSTGRRVAVKRVKKAEKKVSREYQILRAIKGHPHCIECYDIFYTIDEAGKLTQNFVFEYIPDSLEHFINNARQRGERIPMSAVKTIMRQLLEALAFIHEKGIAHRDIKPDNVLLDADLNAKLCDFGSAKVLDTKGKRNVPAIVNRYYRAPELLFGHTDYNTNIDVWAAGCILIELLTLEPIFLGASDGVQPLEIMAILGMPSKEDKEYLYSSLQPSTRKLVEQAGPFAPVDFRSIIPDSYKRIDIAETADLALKMLAWNPHKRLTASQALQHHFFKHM
jgi:glycogen synthase kinase 3 beta